MKVAHAVIQNTARPEARLQLSAHRHRPPHLTFGARQGHLDSRPRLTCNGSDANKKWGDGAGLPENGFDKETASMVLRLLTVRAVQQILVQLQEVNQAQAQWLNHFAAANQPSEGNKFLLKLLKEPGHEFTDPITRSTHNVDPQILAHRILQVRGDMAKGLVTGLAEYSALENTAVLRTHLAASLASGTADRGPLS